MRVLQTYQLDILKKLIKKTHENSSHDETKSQSMRRRAYKCSHADTSDYAMLN